MELMLVKVLKVIKDLLVHREDKVEEVIQDIKVDKV